MTFDEFKTEFLATVHLEEYKKKIHTFTKCGKQVN